MFYFGTNFKSTQLATLEGEFRCASCGFASAVQIIGVGEGVGHSAFMLDDEGARQQALESAELSAENDAADLHDFIGCASCPSCQRIDRRSLARFWLQGVLLAALAVGVFVLIGIGLPLLDPGPTEVAHWIAKVGGIMAVGAIAWVQTVQWFGIRRRILFVEPEEEAQPLARKKKKKRKPVVPAEEA